MLTNLHSLYTSPKDSTNIITDCKWLKSCLGYTRQYSDFILPSEIVSYACGVPYDVPGWDEYIEADLLNKLTWFCPRHEESKIIEEILFTVEMVSVRYYDWLEYSGFPTSALLTQYWIDGRDISGLLVIPGS